MTGVRRGEEAALRKVYDLHAARLFRMLLLLLRDHHQAEDVLQQVFLYAWQHAGSYDARRASVGTWLTQIARSRALDVLRRRRPELTLQDSARVDPPPDGNRLDLLAALAELTAKERRAVELNYFGGYPHTEIARLLTMPVGTVKSTIRRALRKMRGELAREEGADVQDAAPER